MCIKSHNIDSPLDMTNSSGIYMFIAKRREMAILHEMHVHLDKCSRPEHKSVHIDLLNNNNSKLWLKNARMSHEERGRAVGMIQAGIPIREVCLFLILLSYC